MEDVPPGYETRVVALPPREQDDRVTKLDLQTLLTSAPPEHDWIWDGYIEAGALTILHGDGATGKSILAGHLARAVTTGGTCLGRPTTQGNVLIIDAENPIDEIHRRVHALDYSHCPPDTLNYYRASDTILGGGEHPDVDKLRELVQTHQARVAILDSQRGLWAGEEKEALDIRRFYRQLQALAEALECAVILIHHDRRTGNFSGSSDIHNSADTRLHLERPDVEKPERVLHHAKARSSAELPASSYTFSFDQTLGLFTFSQPRSPTTDHTLVVDALHDDEWRTAPEVRERAGIRLDIAKTILWELVRSGSAQSINGIPGRSSKSIGFRRSIDSSRTWDQSGSVDQNVPRRTDPTVPHPLKGVGTGSVDTPDSSHPGTNDHLDPDDIPF